MPRPISPLALGALIACCLAYPTRSGAQGPAERSAIAAFIDSVDQVRTVLGVDEIPPKWTPKQPGGMNEMRRGILEWHKARLSGDQQYYVEAVKQFTRAAQKSRDWPYPWFLLSRLNFEMLAQGLPVPGVTMQRGAAYRRYYADAFRALEQSFKADSTFPPADRFVADYGYWLEWLRTEDVALHLEAAWADEVTMVLARGPPPPQWRAPTIQLTAGGDLPPARLALEAFRDSLYRMTAPEAVRAVWNRWNPTTHFFDPQWGALRLGFIELRVGDLADDPAAYDRARLYFENAKNLAPTEPYGWYGVGLSELGLRRLAMRGAETVEPQAGYKAHYEPTMQALKRSLDMDPGFVPTLELLLTMAVQEDNRVQPAWVLEAIGRVNQLEPAPDPRVFLVRGRHLRNSGEAMAGLSAFEQYVESGGEIGVAALELSRVLSNLGEFESARQAYLAGLEHFSPAVRRVYRRDIVWVAEYYELDDFDAQPTDALPDWIRWFWTKRDATSVRAEGDRLREHLRRWSYVNRAFRVTAPQARAQLNPPLMMAFQACTQDIDRMTLDDLGIDTPTRPNDLRGWEPIYDHRAAVHMRHGFPARRVWQILGAADSVTTSNVRGATLNPPGFNQRDPRLDRRTPFEAPNTFGLEDPSGPGGGGWRETWLYYFAGSPRMVNFQDSRALGPGPTTMVAVIPLTLRYLDALTAFGISMGRDFARVRHDAGARAEGMPRALPYGRCTRSAHRVQQALAKDFEVTAETDSYTLLFPSNLYPTVHAFGMPPASRAPNGTLVVAFSVAYDDLMIEKGGQQPDSVPLRLRVSAIDAVTQRVVHQDTTHTFPVGSDRGSGRHVAGIVEVTAPPGHYDVRVAVQQSDSSSGNVVELGQQVEVWTPDASVRLSDLVTGGGASDELWRFGAEPVPINPLEAFKRSATVDVFYVQSGLRPAATYETVITLTREDVEDPVLSVSFEEVARQPLETKRRGLTLGDVDPGTYRLTLSIREEGTRGAVRRTRVIEVTD